MKIRGEAKSLRLLVWNARAEAQPFWGYEDVGAFFIVPVLLSLILRLLVRFQFLSRFDLINPSVGLQSAVIALLGTGLYFILRFRHKQPILKPLGWVLPKPVYIVTAVIVGPSFAAGIAFYLHLRHQFTPPIPMDEVLILGLVFGPILEESFFRGCLLPVLALSTGAVPAVIITGVVFAVFHAPIDLAHWVTLTATGIAYGWMRVESRTTTTPALMHAALYLTLGLLVGGYPQWTPIAFCLSMKPLPRGLSRPFHSLGSDSPFM